MFVSVGGRRMDLWRAVDGEREVLDVPVQATQWAAGFRLSFRFRP
jgi:transposase-like protein